MPKKKPQILEAEVHALILRDVKIRLGCADFVPEFTLHKTQDEWANWDVLSARNVEAWTPECAQAFKEAEHGPSLTSRGNSPATRHAARVAEDCTLLCGRDGGAMS